MTTTAIQYQLISPEGQILHTGTYWGCMGKFQMLEGGSFRSFSAGYKIKEAAAN